MTHRHVKRAGLVLAFSAILGCGAAPGSVEAPMTPSTPASGDSSPRAESRPAAASSQNGYVVKFETPSHAGERTRVVTDSVETLRTVITREGSRAEEKREKTELHLDAVSTVLEVDGRGRSTHDRYDVKDFTINGERKLVSTIEITRRGKKEDATLLVDGVPARDEVKKALGTLLTLSLSNISTDQVFGSSTPQQVGANWPLDADAARASMKEQGISAGKIKGSTTLRGVSRGDDSGDYLDLAADMSLSDIEVPNPPPGATTENGTAVAHFSGLSPLDGRATHGSSHMALQMSLRMRVQMQGATVIVEVTADNTKDTRLTAM